MASTHSIKLCNKSMIGTKALFVINTGQSSIDVFHGFVSMWNTAAQIALFFAFVLASSTDT